MYDHSPATNAGDGARGPIARRAAEVDGGYRGDLCDGNCRRRCSARCDVAAGAAVMQRV